MSETTGAAAPGTDFIRQIVARDVERGRYGGRVVTRFPPEPNGYMHIGHAKSVCLNFGIAEEFGGRCHLRYDDTNPETEREEYVLAFQDDIRWLGFDWGEHLYFASDYFERMYECAEELIRRGLAYVDSGTEEEIRASRGTVTEPGVAGPFRDRPVEESLDLFRRMRAGEFEDGAHVLRGKIDLSSPNMLMRDPVFYRIRHATHYRQGDAWCLYPLYDYAHCLEDAFEGVTHSICTLEFENNREVYDWILDSLGFEEPRPHQYEFARLELEHAVLSKRRIAPLVSAAVVSGWDDPRLATVRGIRRRGVPPEAVRSFCEMVGVAKANSTVDVGKFEFAIRDALNTSAPRVMAVLDPLRVVLTNYPEGESEALEAPYFPHDVAREGSRTVPFSRELFIERADFEESPPAGYRRLVPGGEVRLRYAYVIRCEEVVHDGEGRVVELRCTYDPETVGGTTPDGRKVKGTIQWVSAPHALGAEVRLFDHLFIGSDAGEEAEADILARVNPESLVVVPGALVEPSVAGDDPDTRYQFERTGYFWRDPVDGRGERLVFNRIVTLRDTWTRRLEAAESEDTATERTRGAVEAAGRGRGRPAGAPARAERDTEGRATASARAGEAAREADPELERRRERYVADLGLRPEDADVLTGSRGTSDFFEEVLAGGTGAQDAAAWIVNDVRGLLGEDGLEAPSFAPAAMAELLGMVAAGEVSRIAAKEVLAEMASSGEGPRRIVEARGLEKVSDEGKLAAAVDDVLSAWPAKVDEYRSGKSGLVGFFVGEVMRATERAADPKLTKRLIEERLNAPS